MSQFETIAISEVTEFMRISLSRLVIQDKSALTARAYAVGLLKGFKDGRYESGRASLLENLKQIALTGDLGKTDYQQYTRSYYS